MALVSTGTTIAFGTSGFTSNNVSISMDNQEREALDVSHLESTLWREFITTRLYDGGDITVEFHDEDEQPPTGAAIETITITFPDASTVTFDGYVREYGWENPLEEERTGTYVITRAGPMTWA